MFRLSESSNLSVRFRFPLKLAFPSSLRVSWQRCNVLWSFWLVITLINNEHTGIYPTHAPASPGQITFLNKPRYHVPALPTYSPTYPPSGVHFSKLSRNKRPLVSSSRPRRKVPPILSAFMRNFRIVVRMSGTLKMKDAVDRVHRKFGKLNCDYNIPNILNILNHCWVLKGGFR